MFISKVWIVERLSTHEYPSSSISQKWSTQILNYQIYPNILSRATKEHTLRLAKFVTAHSTARGTSCSIHYHQDKPSERYATSIFHVPIPITKSSPILVTSVAILIKTHIAKAVVLSLILHVTTTSWIFRSLLHYHYYCVG